MAGVDLLFAVCDATILSSSCLQFRASTWVQGSDLSRSVLRKSLRASVRGHGGTGNAATTAATRGGFSSHQSCWGNSHLSALSPGPARHTSKHQQCRVLARACTWGYRANGHKAFVSNRQAHGDSEAMLGSQLSTDVQNPTRLDWVFTGWCDLRARLRRLRLLDVTSDDCLSRTSRRPRAGPSPGFGPPATCKIKTFPGQAAVPAE